ncbi:unnamed protein product, partial [Ixodes persulcatus]
LLLGVATGQSHGSALRDDSVCVVVGLATVPRSRLRPARSASRSARASKVAPKWQQTTSLKDGASRRRMSRSRRFGVERGRPNSRVPPPPQTVKPESELRQNGCRRIRRSRSWLRLNTLKRRRADVEGPIFWTQETYRSETRPGRLLWRRGLFTHAPQC